MPSLRRIGINHSSCGSSCELLLQIPSPLLKSPTSLEKEEEGEQPVLRMQLRCNARNLVSFLLRVGHRPPLS